MFLVFGLLDEKECPSKNRDGFFKLQSFQAELGAGRLKHVETKYLWLQQQIKGGAIEMDGVATVLSISDLDTKKLTTLSDVPDWFGGI